MTNKTLNIVALNKLLLHNVLLTKSHVLFSCKFWFSNNWMSSTILCIFVEFIKSKKELIHQIRSSIFTFLKHWTSNENTAVYFHSPTLSISSEMPKVFLRKIQKCFEWIIAYKFTVEIRISISVFPTDFF